MCDWSLDTYEFNAFNFILKIRCDNRNLKQTDIGTPVEWHNSITAIHIRVEVVLYPIYQAILTPIKINRKQVWGKHTVTTEQNSIAKIMKFRK